MATLTETDILDEHDALAEDNRVKCRHCGAELDSYDACAFCEPDAPTPVVAPVSVECEICGEQVVAVDGYGWCLDCRDHEDPSPMCNCGTCSTGDYTCIRKD